MTGVEEKSVADLAQELEKARARIAELDKHIAAEEERRNKHAHWALAALDSAGIGAWSWDIGLDRVLWTKTLLTIYGLDEAIFGGTLKDFMACVHQDDRQLVSSRVERIFAHAEDAYFLQHRLVRPDGAIRWLMAHGFVERDASGKPQRLSGISQDITQQVQESAERQAMQQQIIDTQSETLRQLGAPIIPLANNALAMPLVGKLSLDRAKLVTETLLEAVAQRAAAFVILDMTGITDVDTDIANGLLRAAQAVRLLGAKVALTGLQPAVARALVNLGVDMSALETRADLQSGIAWASRGGNLPRSQERKA